jgi:exopolysaccharide production protein ExoZ
VVAESSPEPSSAAIAPGRVIVNVQGLRGVAAFIVIFAHLSGPDGLEERVFGTSWLAWTNGPANTGVDLFFVISGLIMVVTTWRTFGDPGSSRRFLRRRVTRIYPLYWILNTPVVLMILLSPAAFSWVQGQDPQLLQSYLLLPRSERFPLLVAWSLVYEMYFYLFFAIALVIGRRWFPWVVGMWAVITVALHVLVGPTANPYLRLVSDPLNLEFALGILVGWAVTHGRLRFPRTATIVAAVGVTAVWARLASLDLVDFLAGTSRFLQVGIAMSVVVYAAVAMEQVRGVVVPRPLQRLGDASYSLYLTHVPALTVLGLGLARLGPTGTWAHVLVLLLAPVYCVVVAWFCYIWLERPLLRLFRRRRALVPEGRA